MRAQQELQAFREVLTSKNRELEAVRKSPPFPYKPFCSLFASEWLRTRMILSGKACEPSLARAFCMEWLLQLGSSPPMNLGYFGIRQLRRIRRKISP